VVRDFYTPLDKTIQEVSKDAERVQVPVEETGVSCPTCGEIEKGMVVLRTGRFGKFKSCSRFPECKYTENIVEKLEGMLCPLCQKGDVIVKNSRWGKSFYGCGRYPECDWASWGKPDLNLKVSQAEWEMLKAQRAERKKAKEKSPEQKEVKATAKAKPGAKKAKKASKPKAKAKPKTKTKKSVAKTTPA